MCCQEAEPAGDVLSIFDQVMLEWQFTPFTDPSSPLVCPMPPLTAGEAQIRVAAAFARPVLRA